jgi:serine/threonine protein kinase
LFHRLFAQNIIKLHGVAKKKQIENAMYRDQGFFLVLDRLYDTLFTRIHKVWKRRLDQESHPLFARLTGSLDKARRNSTRFLLSRLAVARDLASALAYLHEKRLCHRDFKSDNIGFDAANEVKLFDFGLARKLPRSPSSSSSRDDDSSDDERFHLTQMVGSLRYMSPEVMLGATYNQCCDVYSFSIVLWEIITCQRAYAVFTTEGMFVNKVGREHVRPSLHRRYLQHCRQLANIDNITACQDILHAGWNADLTCRASMREMQAKLEAEMKRLQEEYEKPVQSKKGFLSKTKSLRCHRQACGPHKLLPHALQASRTHREEEEGESTMDGVVWI